MAMAKLKEEYFSPPVLSAFKDIHSPGAEVLRRVVADPSRAARILAGAQSWRASPKDLAASVLADAPGNGFSETAASLSNSEWQALHAELLKQISEK
jgi:hypothetical protein